MINHTVCLLGQIHCSIMSLLGVIAKVLTPCVLSVDADSFS
jgi:hypothetical protein